MELAATRLVCLLTFCLLAPGAMAARTFGEWLCLSTVCGVVLALAAGAERLARIHPA